MIRFSFLKNYRFIGIARYRKDSSPASFMSIALPGPLECRRTESPEIDCRLSAKYRPLNETETEFPLIAALMVEICSPTSELREERNIDFLAVSSESDTWANLSAKIESDFKAPAISSRSTTASVVNDLGRICRYFGNEPSSRRLV